MLRLATETICLEYEETIDAEAAIPEVHLSGRNGTGWQRTLTSTVTATPILFLPPHGESLLIAYGLDLHALDARTGETRWQRHFSEPIWAGQMLGDGQLLLHLELSVACLDTTGADCWRYDHSEIITEIVVEEGQVIAHDFAGRHLALDLKTGVLYADHCGEVG